MFVCVTQTIMNPEVQPIKLMSTQELKALQEHKQHLSLITSRHHKVKELADPRTTATEWRTSPLCDAP